MEREAARVLERVITSSLDDFFDGLDQLIALGKVTQEQVFVALGNVDLRDEYNGWIEAGD